MKSEFDFIDNIKKKYGLARVGDDCAVLPKSAETDLVVTADMLVEDIDFRLDWTTPEMVGHKALAVSLSDIAAMGGEPQWAMLSIAIPESVWPSDFLNRFYDGWHELASEFNVELVGGDVSKSPGKIVIDSTVGGEVPAGKAVMRSGAHADEAIYLAGPLGGAAAGLKILESGRRYNAGSDDWQQAFVLKQIRPTPQIRLGKRLRLNDAASAMIDISDGLSSDLAHLCKASGVGARIFADDLPFESDLMNLAGSVDATLALSLHGGEDFVLLFTSTEEKISRSGIDDVFRIGQTTENVGVIELVRGDHVELLPPGGFRHF